MVIYFVKKVPEITKTKLNKMMFYTDFKYFNLAVLKTINNITTPYLAGTFQVKSNTFQYVYTGNDILDLSMDDILGKRREGLVDMSLVHRVLKQP